MAVRAIGDMVLSTPAIRALSEAFPGASLSVLTEAFSRDVFEANPRLAGILAIDRWGRRELPWPKRVAADISWFRAVRAGRFDAVVDLFSGPRSAQMALVSGAPVRIGEGIRSRRFFYSRAVDVDHEGKHLVEQKMQIVAPLTGAVPIPPPEIFLTKAEEEGAAERLRDAGGRGGPYAGLFPGAGWIHKRWPAEQFAALGDRLAARGFEVALVGGPLDAEVCRRVAGAMAKPPLLLAPLSRLRDSIAVIGRMGLFVSNDTGPMHIAAALGCPTVGLFGPSDIVKYRPWGDRASVVSARLSCSPCPQLQDTCHLHGRRSGDCMERISLEDVVREADRVLDRPAAAPAPGGGRR